MLCRRNLGVGDFGTVYGCVRVFIHKGWCASRSKGSEFESGQSVVTMAMAHLYRDALEKNQEIYSLKY